jgi:hypothetical protein
MHMSGAIQAETDRVIVFLEELAPLIVQQGAVGLHGVPRNAYLVCASYPAYDTFPGTRRLYGRNRLHQRWLAALPGYSNLRTTVRLAQLADISLQSLFAHTKLDIGVEKFLVQEQTVRTG